jgi:hypothetical protein
MSDAGMPLALSARLIGPVAAHAIGNGATGTVHATFDRSFYLTFPSGWLCVGPAGLGAGPLNVLCDPWPHGGTHELVAAGDRARAENGKLRAGRISLQLHTAATWHPQPVGAWTGASLARGLSTFATLLPAALPREGLAYLLRDAGDGEGTPLATAQPAIRYLAGIVHASERGHAAGIDAQQLFDLIGLGPGLTPSGDDYLCGFLIALALTSRFALRDHIWRAVEPHLGQRTNDISRAHLGAAAEGFGNAALHLLLNAILAGANDQIPAGFSQAIAIGHTSGWDALAGAIAVLRALDGPGLMTPQSFAASSAGGRPTA